jgi:hypothetical protein
MNRKKILESWKKYRLKKEIKKLNRYFTTYSPNSIGDEEKLVIDTAGGRERRLPLRMADVKTEYLKKAFKGAKMGDNPITSTSDRESINRAYRDYMGSQERQWSQLDVPERRADRLRKAKALLAYRRRPRP